MAVETRLNNLAIPGSLYTSGGWKSDNLVASLGRGQQSQEPVRELKSLLGHRKVETHSMIFLVGREIVVWYIR